MQLLQLLDKLPSDSLALVTPEVLPKLNKETMQHVTVLDLLDKLPHETLTLMVPHVLPKLERNDSGIQHVLKYTFHTLDCLCAIDGSCLCSYVF